MVVASVHVVDVHVCVFVCIEWIRVIVEDWIRICVSVFVFFSVLVCFRDFIVSE